MKTVRKNQNRIREINYDDDTRKPSVNTYRRGYKMARVYVLNEKGAALLIALTIMLALTLLGAAATMTASIEINIAGNQRTSTKAFYAADAGIEHAKALLFDGTVSDTGSQNDPNWNKGNSYTTWGFNNTFNILHKLEGGNVALDSKGNPLYVVSSTGSSINNALQQIEAVLNLTYFTAFDYGVFGDEGVTIDGDGETDSYNSDLGSYSATQGSNVDVGTNAIGANSITLGGNAKLHGNAMVGHGGNAGTDISITGNATVDGDKDVADDEKNLPVPAFPTTPFLVGNYTLLANNQDTWYAGTYDYDSITVTGTAKLTIDGDVIIYVSDMTISANGFIDIVSGSLTIYFSNSLNVGGNGILNNTQTPSNLLIYGTQTAANVLIGGNGDLYGAVYAPEADITVTGNGDIYGSIVGDTVDVPGNGNIHYDESLADIQDYSQPEEIVLVYWREK